MANKIIRCGVLRPSVRVQIEFAAGMRRAINEMTRETKAEVLALFRADAPTFDHADDVYARTARELGFVQAVPAEAVAMDASFADMAQRLMDRLLSKFSILFDRIAGPLTDAMVSDTLKTSATGLQSSLREVSKGLTLEVTPRLAEMIDASTAEGVSLIKRIPSDYLPQVQGDVMRSITTGNGLADLVPALESRNVKIKNWADNVAKDQTRKAYGNLNKVRMQENGVKKYEWIHSGGANKPREFHMARAPSGLNGGIFTLAEPPIIDERTGERGIPGQLPYCGCTMRPIIDLSDED